MIFSEQDTLPNGVTIPRLALGTWFLPNQQAAEAVKTALSIGYRHIDTAQAYGNEAGVGEGIRRSGIPREEIFVTSKVAAEHKSYATAAQSIHQTLTTMGLDYVDLMLIHSPQPWAEVNQSDNRYFPENRQVWRALEDALSAGKVRAIGVSNFQPADLENLWATAAVKPMVNQVLCHISNTPLSLLSFCRSCGILLEAYSPVAHGEAKKNPTDGPTVRGLRPPALHSLRPAAGHGGPPQGSKPGAHAGKRLPGLYHLRGGYGPASAPAPHSRLWPLPPLPCVWGQKERIRRTSCVGRAVRFPCAFPKNHLSPERELWYTTVVFLSFDPPSHERSLFWT